MTSVTRYRNMRGKFAYGSIYHRGLKLVGLSYLFVFASTDR